MHLNSTKKLSDDRRRELAVRVRACTIPDLLDQFKEANVYRAYVTFENGVFSLSHPSILAPVQSLLELSQDFAEHEGIFIGREDGIETLFFAFVHDTRRGLSQGGLRFTAYASVADVLVDGLRLSEGMTRKNALASLWWGGGKGIIPLPPGLNHPDEFQQGPERRRLFEAYGRFVASLGGVYYTAEDVGTKTADMDAILSQNRFTTCISEALGGSGNPSPYTAKGVLRAMQAAWLFLTGTENLAGVRVAVQGAGNVGRPLIELLDDAGARLWIADVSTDAIQKITEQRPHIQVVAPDEIFDLDVDVLSPCARGGVINSETIPRLKARLICGAANNILREDRYDPERLRERGITFVPDYVCNRMGITNCADEWLGHLSEDVRLAAERVYPDTLRVLKHARNLVITPTQAANELADIAASELNPLLGHRGRRIIDHLMTSGWSDYRPDAGAVARRRRSRNAGAKLNLGVFDPALDEPRVRVKWEKQGRLEDEDSSVAAAPISAASKPNLASFLSPLLCDVRARYLESKTGRPPRRVLGSDHGGLGLQFSVERSLAYGREEIGRAEFVEKCRDYYNINDAATREQLHQLGINFDPRGWIDPMSGECAEVVRRAFYALKDAGLVTREERWGYRCPRCQTVLVASEVRRDTLKVSQEYTIRFKTASGETVETRTPFPEMLVGAVAVAVDSGERFSQLAGQSVKHPLLEDDLPVIGVQALGAPAVFLVPSHSPADERLARVNGISKVLVVFERDGGVRGFPGMPAERVRQVVLERLGSDISAVSEQEPVDVHRCRRCQSIVYPEISEQLFVSMTKGAEMLRNGIESGAVEFTDDRWRRRALDHLSSPEPWCISRQQWWGNELPENHVEVLSTWFTLTAWSLCGAGWPDEPSPAPISEVFTDPDFLIRWVVPSQIVSYMVTGRPAFGKVHVHGTLSIIERSLKPRAGVGEQARDEERFIFKTVRRPMRHTLGNVVEPGVLVRRFGADALRLGYLLCLDPGFGETATASESYLRKARKSVRQLTSKMTGLSNMLGAPARVGPPRLADMWITARCRLLAEGAREAYEENRLDGVALALVSAVDDFAAYANVAAARRRGADDLGAVPSTVSTVVKLLSPTFAPVCPHLFEKLGEWVAEKWPEAEAATGQESWLCELVGHLSASRGEPVVVATNDPATLGLLESGRSELAALSKAQLSVTNAPPAGKATAVGPCVVVRPGGLSLPDGDSPAAAWYASLHGEGDGN